jgi:uncharacterized membrane protein YkvI
MSDIITSFFGTLGVSAIYGLLLFGLLHLVVKNINMKKQEQERLDKQKELADAFKKA